MPNAETMLSYRIRLPWDRPPLSANDRRHHMAQARAVAEVRRDAGWTVKAIRIPRCSHLTVGLVYVPTIRRRRDGAENYGPTLKAIVDAIATDLQIVPDDTSEYVTRLMPVVTPVDRDNAGVFLAVEAALTEDGRWEQCLASQ